MSIEKWQILVDECRKQNLPVVITFTEPWFSIQYLCANFLMIEKVADFTRKCKDAAIPIMRVNQKVLIRFSDIERVCLEQSPEIQDRVQNPVPAAPEATHVKPRRRPKGGS